MMMTAPGAHLRRAPGAENVENETPAIVQTTLEEESTNFSENQNPQATGVGVASVERLAKTRNGLLRRRTTRSRRVTRRSTTRTPTIS